MWPFRTKPRADLAPVRFTNTLTGTKDLFTPLRAGVVSMYSCGPTVYSKAHVGNLRPYIFSDTVARILKDAGYHVRRVINITDVGHLVSDGDEGEDKMQVGAKREGITAEEVAERYMKLFIADIEALNLDTNAILFPRATEYIKEQIAMVGALDKGGHTYRTKDGLYFDTATFPGYGRLGGGDSEMRAEYAVADLGRRITGNAEKRHPADFALWKFSPFNTQRLQEWPSPWGTGFPGWHIECSAMTDALLGPELDIHTGGMDHIPVHHNNEIAQSESVSGKPLSRFWLHSAFITLDSERIAKSLGNEVYLSDLPEHGYHPLALRYLFLQAHFRSPVSFSWESVAAADEALKRLWRMTARIKKESRGKGEDSDEARAFIAQIRDDVSTPAALALLWESLGDEALTARKAWGLIERAEAVLGLSLTHPPEDVLPQELSEVPKDVQALAREREAAREAKDYARSDELRIHILNRGYQVEDTASGPLFTKKLK